MLIHLNCERYPLIYCSKNINCPASVTIRSVAATAVQ